MAQKIVKTVKNPKTWLAALTLSIFVGMIAIGGSYVMLNIVKLSIGGFGVWALDNTIMATKPNTEKSKYLSLK